MPKVPATEQEDEKQPKEQLPPGEQPEPKSSGSANRVPEVYTGTAEKTMQESAWVSKSLYKPFNPDDLYQLTSDYSIYEDMEVDDQVSIAMQLKRDLVIGSGWSIVTQEEDQQEACDKIYESLEMDTDAPFDDILEEIIDVAYTKGFSISEKIFKRLDDGSLALKNIKTRYPNSWLLHTDDQGNITKYEQLGVRGSIKVNPDSLIHYINNPRHQNPYGHSDLRKAYEAWMVKRHIVRFYSIFLEKAAGPIPVAKYNANVPRSKVEDVHNAIKNFQAKTALTIPQDFEIEFLKAEGNGEAYVKGLDLFNMYIGRALVIPDLLGFQGGETAGGSFSLGQGQISVFYKHIMRRRRALEHIINKHVIIPLYVWNYGPAECYPKFQLAPISDDKALDYAKTYLELVKGKIYKPTAAEINHFKDLIKFPLSDEDDIEWLNAGSGGAFNPVTGEPMIDPATGEPVDPNATKPGGEEQDGQQEEGNDGKDGEKPEGQKPEAEGPASEARFTDLGHYSRKKKYKADASERVNYKALANALDYGRILIMKESEPIVSEIMQDFLEQIRKKDIIVEGEEPKLDRFESIKMRSLRKLQQLLIKHFKTQYMEAKGLARKELGKANFAEPLPTDQFLKFLDDETYHFVGDWSYNVIKKARQEIISAIKDGKPMAEALKNIEEVTDAMSDVAIERYARTKLTEVMNKARIEAFEESGIVAAYEYSAILDDRTTEICAALDGKIFEAGSQPVPPLHFNCRSVLVPITRFETYQVDKTVGGQPIDEFIEENKGEGFSTK